MSEQRLLNVLLSPHVSEKSTLLGEMHNQYVFKVVKDANKHEVKQAIELLFNVTVNAVRTVNCRGKEKRFGQRKGQRSSFKKAYVALADGQDIDFAVEG